MDRIKSFPQDGCCLVDMFFLKHCVIRNRRTPLCQVRRRRFECYSRNGFAICQLHSHILWLAEDSVSKFQ